MKRLEGKVALVTGAVGGIGTAIVEDFLAEGAKVILCDVKAEDVLARTDELARAGWPVYAAPADIGNLEALRAAVDAAVEQAGPIDIVVANANIGGHRRQCRRSVPYDRDGDRRHEGAPFRLDRGRRLGQRPRHARPAGL